LPLLSSPESKRRPVTRPPRGIKRGLHSIPKSDRG
jgi:hypothetical protein